MKKGEGKFWAIVIFVILLLLGCWGGILYITGHFIKKFW